MLPTLFSDWKKSKDPQHPLQLSHNKFFGKEAKFASIALDRDDKKTTQTSGRASIFSRTD